MLLLVHGAVAFWRASALTPRTRRKVRQYFASSALGDDASFTIESVQSMFKGVRQHYRKTGEVAEAQVCRNMMVTRVNDFSHRLERCCVDSSAIHGDGLFATRQIEKGELVTFFPGDALLVWEDGDRNGDVMIFFGAHIPQSERDAAQVTNERVKQYELYSSPMISAVGDPARRDDPTYLGHFANDARRCDTPDDVESYRQESSAAANVEAVLLEGCHFALRAVTPVSPGDELLRSYGEGYWLARGGHAGVGVDLPRIGSPLPARDQSERLKQALKRSRPQRKAGSGRQTRSAAAESRSMGGSGKAKGKRSKARTPKGKASNTPVARGFGTV